MEFKFLFSFTVLLSFSISAKSIIEEYNSDIESSQSQFQNVYEKDKAILVPWDTKIDGDFERNFNQPLEEIRKNVNDKNSAWYQEQEKLKEQSFQENKELFDEVQQKIDSGTYTSFEEDEEFNYIVNKAYQSYDKEANTETYKGIEKMACEAKLCLAPSKETPVECQPALATYSAIRPELRQIFLNQCN